MATKTISSVYLVLVSILFIYFAFAYQGMIENESEKRGYLISFFLVVATTAFIWKIVSDYRSNSKTNSLN